MDIDVGYCIYLPPRYELASVARQFEALLADL